MFDNRVEAGKKGLTSQRLICYQCQGANVIILLLPGSPLSTEESPDFFSMAFQSLLWPRWHIFLFPIPALPQKHCFFTCVELFHCSAHNVPSAGNSLYLFFVSIYPASAHLSKSHEAFSDPTQRKLILSNSIALCTFFGILTTFSFRTLCIYGGFCLPWETNCSLEAGLFLTIITLIIPIYIPSHSRNSIYVHWVNCPRAFLKVSSICLIFPTQMTIWAYLLSVMAIEQTTLKQKKHFTPC